MMKIVFFIESDTSKWFTCDKIGKMFMNLSTINENATVEILKILELESYGQSDKELYAKLMTDFKMFEDGVKSLNDFGNDSLVPHFIFCTDVESYEYRVDYFAFFVLAMLKKYKIPSLIFTCLSMRRKNLITKEELEQAYTGSLKSVEGWKYEKLSINDDLESFVTDLIQNQDLSESQISNSFFTPKLSQEELDLIEQGNIDYLSSFHDFDEGFDPDVDPEKMLKSDSKNKYLHNNCLRKTVLLMAGDC